MSDSALRYDRDVNVPLYSRHGIPEVSIVDLVNRGLRWYRALCDGSYTDQGATKTPDLLPVAALLGTAIELTGLLIR